MYKWGVACSGFFALVTEDTINRLAAEDGSVISCVGEDDGISMVNSRSAGGGSVIYKSARGLRKSNKQA